MHVDRKGRSKCKQSAEMLQISFYKCFCCAKSFNIEHLNEINDSIAFVNDVAEEILFTDLILDVCGVKIDENEPNYVCSRCNDSLVSFHFFKRDVKKYSSFSSHIEKLEIMTKVEDFLAKNEGGTSFHLAENQDSCTVSITRVDAAMKTEEDRCEEDDILPGDSGVTGMVPQTNSTVSQNFAVETYEVDHFVVVDEQKLAFEDSPGASEETIPLENLDEPQKQENSSNCPICDHALPTQSSLNEHLREVHILRNNRMGTVALKAESASSKVVLETANGIETVWQCKRCDGDRIFRNDQAFRLHVRMTHIRALKIDKASVASCKISVDEENGPKDCWKCPDCDRIFRHRDSLRHHIKLVHMTKIEEHAKQERPADGALTDETLSRIAKKLECTEQGKSQNYCYECGLKFGTTRFKLRVHRESHEIFRQLAPHVPNYRCEPCRMMFCSETALKQHLEVHGGPTSIEMIPAEGLAHYGATRFKSPTGDADNVVDPVDESTWKCGHCHVQYFDKHECISHIMLLHTAPLSCFIDNQQFQNSFGLSKYLQHMKNKHPELFPNLKYPCAGCAMEFSSVYDKLAHQKGCKSKKFQCDRCGKRFPNKQQLQSHILYELGLSGFVCGVCNKRCRTLSDLKIHENVHSNARPYVCSLCPKTFKTPGARSTHVETHSKAGFTCETCGQKLASRTLYQRHKRHQHNHTFRLSQLKNNLCTLCQRNFLRTSHYRRHMMKIHEIVMT